MKHGRFFQQIFIWYWSCTLYTISRLENKYSGVLLQHSPSLIYFEPRLVLFMSFLVLKVHYHACKNYPVVKMCYTFSILHTGICKDISFITIGYLWVKIWHCEYGVSRIGIKCAEIKHFQCSQFQLIPLLNKYKTAFQSSVFQIHCF